MNRYCLCTIVFFPIFFLEFFTVLICFVKLYSSSLFHVLSASKLYIHVRLREFYFALLQDNIPSVRQGAAIAIANVVRAYGKDVLPLITEKMKEGLKGTVADEELLD